VPTGSPAPRITLVVARARGGAIGRDNALPWHLPEDLRHFKATTLGHTMVMGRRTFESIGRPLPGRTTIVVSRAPSWSHPGTERAGSLEEALAACAGRSEVFVVGGGQLYAEAMQRADRLLVTEIDLDVDADTFFPPIDPAHWRCEPGAPSVGAQGVGYRIDTWLRR
jgi:dihydrofolate reductase